MMKETENLNILNKGDDLPYTPDQTAEPYGNSRDRSGLCRTGTGSSEEPAGSKAFDFSRVFLWNWLSILLNRLYETGTAGFQEGAVLCRLIFLHRPEKR